MEDKIYYILAWTALIGVAFVKALRNVYIKKYKGLSGCLYVIGNSMLGGIVLGLLFSVYFENQKTHFIGLILGSWKGDETLDFMFNIIEEKLNGK